ncbi:MAG: hypothetical protein IKW10_03345 [Oscillospiraceae bacterium]|nr:hypothetical protein [Oscillospiraceae bacterium]
MQYQVDEQRDNITHYMIAISCVCIILQLYSIPRKISSLLSLANYGHIFIWVILGGWRIFKRFAHAIPNIILPVFIVIASAALSCFVTILNYSGVITTSVTALVNFLVLPAMLMHCAIYPIPQKSKRLVVVVGVIMSLVFIDLYRSEYRTVFETEYGRFYGDEVTLGYPNPNQTAMFLFVAMVILSIGVFFVQKVFLKVLLIADAAYMGIMLEQTQSRAGLLLLIIFLTTICVIRKWSISQKIVKLVVLLPCIYAIIAMFYLETFGDLTLWGESIFNGREGVYGRYLENLNTLNFVLGDFARFSFANLHNSYVSIAATAGIVTVVSFVYFFRQFLLSNHECAMTQGYAKIAYIGFLCIIIHSCAEAAFLVAGSIYAFLVFMVVMMFSQPIYEYNDLSKST